MSKDWIQNIYTCNKKICKFLNNAYQVITKIKKMFIKTVKKKFFA